ncbi:MAG TPA: efflux RND transporter permease subunit [Longimicrobiaceae bacterium]|nr:efflux RND transporter permease subunit [Longimicrobiaceae bacterium]
MFISDFAIKRPVVTVVTMLALVVFGIFALLNLKTDEYPEVAPPVVVVSVPYPGASPETVEREVVDRVEESIGGISGVKQIDSQSFDGYAVLIVQFIFGKDLQQASQEIRDQISQIRNDLPQEMKEPILSRFDPNQFPIVSITLSSNTLGPAELTRIADPGLTRDLRAVPGVAEVTVAGGIERELTVELDPQRMQAAQVGVPQVVAALQAQNLAAPVGAVKGTWEERSIRLKGRLPDPESFQRLVVTERQGAVVRLGDVANVRDGTEEPRTLALYNGRPAVGIDIKKSTGYSTTQVSSAIVEQVNRLEATLPQGVKLNVIRNSGERVSHSVQNVEETLFLGALLTVLVVFLFLNSWRSTVITGVALPISVLAAFVAVWAFGFTLNTMSLLGLSLAIGILIDDAIVVRENIVRHVEMGKDHYQAAMEGTDEIGLAVAATTFSIVCVFVPIAFMGGVAQQWFAPFALTIASSVLVSLFVSFSLDPMLSAYWSDPHKEEHEKGWVTRRLDAFNRWFERRSEDYKGVVAWALDHRAAMMVIAMGAFVGALMIPVKGIIAFGIVMAITLGLAVFLTVVHPRKWIAATVTAVGIVAMFMAGGAAPAMMKLGGQLFPTDDRSEFIVKIDTPPGSNIDYTRMKAEEVARLARSHPEVSYTYTTVGGQGGTVNQATIYARMIPKADRPKSRSQDIVSNQVREAAGRLGGVTVALSNGSFGDQKQIQIQLRGPDITVLNRVANAVMTEVQQVPGAVDVGLSTKGQKPELEVELNRGLAGTLGVTAGQVAQALRPAFAGIDAGDWVDPSGETRDVEVRLAPEARRRAVDLSQMPLVLQGPTGTTVLPLGQVATIRQGIGPAQIDHLDRDRVITVQANTQGRPLTEVIGDINARIGDHVRIPAGYVMTQGGETKDQGEIFGRIIFALGVAVMLMYLILVVQFGSFLDPLAIMLSLPLSLIGVVLGLWLTGNTLNIMSMIGVILLAGIVAKNAILLIDFAKWAHERGTPLRESLIEAGSIRLRPILMTTFALIAGMLPVAMGAGEGAQFRAPMGVAVIGGVITSTLLTLLVIPTVYEVLDDTREWMFGLFRRTPAEARHPAREHAPRPVLDPGYQSAD